MTSYVRLKSWHVVTEISAHGWGTRCGKVAPYKSTVTDQLHVEEVPG